MAGGCVSVLVLRLVGGKGGIVTKTTGGGQGGVCNKTGLRCDDSERRTGGEGRGG